MFHWQVGLPVEYLSNSLILRRSHPAGLCELEQAPRVLFEHCRMIRLVEQLPHEVRVDIHGTQRPIRAVQEPVRALGELDGMSHTLDGPLQITGRVDLDEVEMDDTGEFDGKVLITIHFTIRATNSRSNIVFPYYKNEGTNI